jgi:isopentenyldiphosphate isomerase
MVDELYDTFDRAGNKTGVASFEECHAKGLIHKTAALLLFKDVSRRETLIHQRSAMMHQSAGEWQSAAGGHIPSGASVEAGMRLEIQEELFHNAPVPDFAIREIRTFFNNDLPGNYEFLTIFEGVYPGPFFPNPQEIFGEPVWIEWDGLLRDMKQRPTRYCNVFHNIVREYLNVKQEK